jgi:hypothetical protein
MLVEVSVGDLLDRLSILDIKKSKILNVEQLAAIDREIEALSSARKYSNDFPACFWYKLLVHVNTQIWNFSDEVKTFEHTADPLRYATLANSIFDYNDRRYRIKNRFNRLYDSSLQEQKGYAKQTLAIKVDSLDLFYSKLSVINEYSLKYDAVVFISDYVKEITSIYPAFSVVKDVPENATVKSLGELKHEGESEVYEFTPIRYLSHGKMGDFIHALSVIAENFWNTGRKGVLYISDIAEKFSYSLEKAYEDTKELMTMQPYIKSYHIFTNQDVDIDLAVWRRSPYLFRESWNKIYQSTYGVNWGSRKWLFIPDDDRFKNKILIHTSQRRPNLRFNMNEFRNIYRNEDIVFISEFQFEYDDFIVRHSCTSIPFMKVDSIMDFFKAIASCKYFIGNLSMPICVADAMFKDRLALLCGIGDDLHRLNMDNIWPMCKVCNA